MIEDRFSRTMSDPEQELVEIKRRRVRKAKRFLRFLPRRATVHRYPGLGRFAPFARRFPEIWQFRRGPVLRAIWFGCILTFAPLFGLQILTSVFLSILARANLPIMVGLMLVTNQFTAFPIYAMNFLIGEWVIGLFDGGAHHGSLTKEIFDAEGSGFFGQAIAFFQALSPMMFVALLIGGLIVGLASALIIHGIYWIFSHLSDLRMSKLYQRVHAHREAKHSAQDSNKVNSSSNPATEARY